MADALTIKKRWERGVARQSTCRPQWQTLADYILPHRATITHQPTPGSKQTDKLFDSEGHHDAQTLTFSLAGAMLSASQKWFGLTMRQKDLNASKAVADWLEEVADRTYAALNQSNFTSESGECLLDLVVFGTGALFIEEADAGYLGAFGGLRFKAFPLGEYIIEEDAEGRVNALIRRFSMPAAAAAATWPAVAAHPELKSVLVERPDEPVWILHGLVPRDARKPTLQTRDHMAVAECYVLDVKVPVLLDEGGYLELPVAVPRWMKTSGETYGRSPAWVALPDIKSLNRAVELYLSAMGKALDPTLLVDDESLLSRLSLAPGALVYREPGSKIEPLESAHRLDYAEHLFDRLERKIKEVFFADALRLRFKPTMTATEVVALQEEMLRLLGPTAGRLYPELLSIVVERSVGLLARAGQLPPTPQELLDAGGGDIDIQYEGPLARAQKSADLLAIERFNQHLGAKAAAKQDLTVWDVVDDVEQDLHYAAIAGVPSNTMRGKEDVAAMRQARADAKAAQDKLAMLAQTAESAGKAAPMLKVMADAGAGAERAA